MNNDLIQVDGKFYKNHQVVILPTETKSKLYQLLTDKKLYIGDNIPQSDSQRPNQHLYILSDEEIKEGDWYIGERNTGPQLLQCKEIKEGMVIPTESSKYPYNIGECKKVIATTDSSLTQLVQTLHGKAFVSKELPRPSDAFVQKLVEECNKGNVITEVLVEYEGIEWLDRPLEYFIKTAPDNTITIKPVEKTWDDIFKNFQQLLNKTTQEVNFKTWLQNNYQVPKKK